MRHHSIDYIEIYVTNMMVAQQFYTAAFQWRFTDYSPEYAGIQRGHSESEAGGLCVRDRVVPGGPLVVLYSNDLESSLQAVRDAGGEITLGIVAFPGGRRFQFRDPSGNELAVWSDQ